MKTIDMKTIEWRINPTLGKVHEVFVNDALMGWIYPRPHYCDRGHWQASVQGIRDLDEQDGFPRYYMRLETAKQEMEDFLRWRLWKERIETL